MKRDPQLMKSAGRASAVGWEMSIAIVGGMLLGWWADKRFGTEPWLLILGISLGTLVGFRALFRVVKLMNEEEEEQDKR